MGAFWNSQSLFLSRLDLEDGVCLWWTMLEQMGRTGKQWSKLATKSLKCESFLRLKCVAFIRLKGEWLMCRNYKTTPSKKRGRWGWVVGCVSLPSSFFLQQKTESCWEMYRK